MRKEIRHYYDETLELPRSSNFTGLAELTGRTDVHGEADELADAGNRFLVSDQNIDHAAIRTADFDIEEFPLAFVIGSTQLEPTLNRANR